MIILALLIPVLAIAGANANKPSLQREFGKSTLTLKDLPDAGEAKDLAPGKCTDSQSSAIDEKLETTRLNYEKLSARDPNNADILLALAAIAERRNQPDHAQRLRQQAMRANPQSPEVMARTLGALKGGRVRKEAESHLRTWLAAHPRSAALHFALGNLLAQQGRWDEAEPAYFNAVSNEVGNPDFLFNLAVSLDHLRHYGLASQHYLLALEAARKRPAGFSEEQVRQRLAELQPTGQAQQ